MIEGGNPEDNYFFRGQNKKRVAAFYFETTDLRLGDGNCSAKRGLLQLSGVGNLAGVREKSLSELGALFPQDQRAEGSPRSQRVAHRLGQRSRLAAGPVVIAGGL